MMKNLKKWFYYGFKKWYKLSWTHKFGASQKLSKDWEVKKDNTNRGVNETVTRHQKRGKVRPIGGFLR